MPSYPHSWLYVSDPFGTPQELINGARTARNMQSANLCGNGVFDNVLTNLGCDGYAYAPSLPPALSDPVLWLDALDGSPTREIAPNRGTGGPLLNGTLGATTASSTDQPMWLGGTEKYLYTPAVAGNYASIPSSAPVQITGDIEILLRLAADDWTPASQQALLSKYVTATAGYIITLNTAGTLSFFARLAASDITVTSTAALPASAAVDGRTLWLKVSRASASGTVNFSYALDAGNTAPTTWTQLGTAVVSTTGAMTAGAQAVNVGENNVGGLSAGAKFFRAIIRSAIDATTPTNVLDVDFTANSSQASFTATAGGVATINRSSTGRKSVAYLGRPLWLFGTDDFITIPDNPLLDFAANESFTVVAVLRHHNPTATANVVLAKQTTFGTTVGWALGMNATGTTFSISDGAANILPQGSAPVASAQSVIAGVRDTTADTGTAYTNGTAGTPLNDTTTATLNNSLATRAGSSLAPASFLDAEVTALLVWRRALTAAEILQVSAFYRSTAAVAGRCWTTVDFSAGSNPWYNARQPESVDAYGFIVEEWTGLDGAHHVRSAAGTGQNRGGAYYGPQSHNQRTMKLNVLLHGGSERGLEHLFRWLEARLLNCCGSNCDSQFAWLRTVCPADPDNVPQEGVLRGERVVLLEGPTWEASPVAEHGGCFIRRASFTLGVGDPCFYREAEPAAFAEVTASGQGVTQVLSNCSTFAGDGRQVRAQMSGPPSYGLTAPVVTITSPAQTILSTRAGLPVLRIAGYSDPNGTGVACNANLIGELILAGAQTSGYEIVVDMAKRRIRMRPIGSATWIDGSRLMGRSLRSGLTRWWSFGPCDSGFVVVEPAYTSLATSILTPTLTQVTTWAVGIESATRLGCC